VETLCQLQQRLRRAVNQSSAYIPGIFYFILYFALTLIFVYFTPKSVVSNVVALQMIIVRNYLPAYSVVFSVSENVKLQLKPMLFSRVTLAKYEYMFRNFHDFTCYSQALLLNWGLP
jgi:hypothetical protein